MFNPLCSLTKPINSTHSSRPSFLIFIYCRLTKLPLLYTAAAAAAKSLQSCPTLCNPIDSNPPGSAVLGILQAKTLEWVAISFSNALKMKSESEVAQLCLTLRDPMDCSLPGSSVHGIFQARVLYTTSSQALKYLKVC